MAKLVRIVYHNPNSMFDDDKIVSILPLISESETMITFKTPDGRLFSATILEKDTNTIYFDTYDVSDVVLFKGGK